MRSIMEEGGGGVAGRLTDEIRVPQARASAAIFSTGLIVPSELETCGNAIILVRASNRFSRPFSSSVPCDVTGT